MVKQLLDTYKVRIENNKWMTKTTIAKALEKLSKFTVKIGYPETFDNYDDIEFTNGQTYLDMVLAVNMRSFAKAWKQNGEKVDKTRFGMTPWTVNAYYDPSENAIAFPAGILQPPFFYPPTAEEPLGRPAESFGSIGAVIGHEITHGFDSTGRLYDGNGNLVDWWLPADDEKFQEESKQLIEQYNAYTVVDGTHVNGKLTLGENIADLGGMSVSYYAFEEFLKKNEDKLPANDKFTPRQAFFVAWARGWRVKARDAFFLNQVATDPHSPGQFRADGSLSNFAPFHEAFGVKEGDRMFIPLDKRVEIW
jgi:putative endopeptidase